MKSHLKSLKIQNLITLLFFGFFSLNTFALVDYSEEENVVPNRKTKPKIVKRKAPRTKSTASSRSSGSSSYRPTGMFDVSLTYETLDLDTTTGGKVNVTQIDGHFETGASIYFDAKYWLADTKVTSLSSTSDSQTGNPEVTVGFNWLAFGSGGSMTNIDLLAGARFKASNSELGSTRTDKIIGVNTVKTFNQFALGLGYKLYLTGTPDVEDELVIGNIQKLSATFGWMISNDIQFELEGAAWKVNAGTGDTKPNVLTTSDSFGSITPTLGLRISSMVKVNLGATFVSSRSKQKDKLTEANLWDAKGLYGSSINASLNISI